MRQIQLLLMVLMPALVFAQTPPESGSVRGVLQTEDDRSPARLRLVVQRAAQRVAVAGSRRLSLARGESEFSAAVSPDAAGSFSIARLPKGRYAYCIVDPQAEYLDPCLWGSIPTFSVTGDHLLPAILARRGSRLEVQVDDPSSLVRLPSPGRQTNLIIGVWTTSNRFHGLRAILPEPYVIPEGRVAGQAAPPPPAPVTRHVLDLAVPPGESLRLRVFSRDLLIRDAGGQTIDTLGPGNVLTPPNGGRPSP